MISNADHKEKAFENAIVQGFVRQGWQHSSNDSGFDPKTGLYAPDLFAWMDAAYRDEFEQFKQTNAKWQETFLSRIEQCLIQKGTLRTLQDAVGITGMPFFKLSEKEPENLENHAVVERYGHNILRVMQQVHFRVETTESIDLVFFINGIPVATAEVKTNFTQDINDAVEEYRRNRHPKLHKTSSYSALLKPGRGAIVHFAISETDIQMTTKLEGETTRFLPFNMGNDGHAGNPSATVDNPYPVSYFWEVVGRPKTWLRLFHSFVFTEAHRVQTQFGNWKTDNRLIFPRYHQLRAVTKIVDDAIEYGVGRNYLIEHSPGSGKTKTITWTAFRLTEIREPNGKAVFDTILIITDRTNLNDQLLAAVNGFSRTPGLVQGIDRKAGTSKTASLQKALEKGVRIVVVTIQTFPFAMEQIILNEKLRDRSFAVIIDEAHNSQSSTSSSKLNAALGLAGKQTTNQSLEDFIETIQKSHKRPANVSFLGFTATPRHQTMMLFGRTEDGSPVNLTCPGEEKVVSFDLYSMRQAIEEGFIIDVLKGYTPYEEAWKLEHSNPKNPLVNERDAKRSIAKWKNLHPTNVSQKTDFIINHFVRNVAGLLNGQAKAMIVTSSRAAVVRYKMAFDKYFETHPDLNKVPALRLGVPIAAFSGDVQGADVIHEADREQGFTLIDPEAVFNEENLNPEIRGALEEAFDKEEYRLMIVANKFQTGFDQPKLCAMYIDKALGSEIEIVQTYSRLNRIYPAKDAVFIVDFVNQPKDVQKAFKKYDAGATVNEIQNSDVIFSLRESVLAASVFSEADVTDFKASYYYSKLRTLVENKKSKDDHAVLNRIFEPLATSFNLQLRECYEGWSLLTAQLEKDEESGNEARIAATREALEEQTTDLNLLENFRKTLNKTVSTYNYLAQMVDYNNPDLEVFVAFCSLLSKYLKHAPKEEIDLSGVLLTNYTIRQLPKDTPEEAEKDATPLKPIRDTTHDPHPEMPEHLKTILEKISNFAGDIIGSEDAVRYCCSITEKMQENDQVMVQVLNNDSESARKGLLEPAVHGAVIDLFDQYKKLTQAVMLDNHKKDELVDIVLSLLKTKTTETQLRGA